MDQKVFENVYRGRQQWYHHVAYMRMGKVLLAREIMRQAGICLANQRVLDYGFGAGTLFCFLPRSAAIFGIELDEIVCKEVAATLKKKGFTHVDLRSVHEAFANGPQLLQQRYNLIILSHVLEHLPDPAGFLRFLRNKLEPGGRILGLVPIHERHPNPHHVQAVDCGKIQNWSSQGGFHIRSYVEGDPWLFWIQPIFNYDRGWQHRLAQVISFALGCLATPMGPRTWFQLGRVFGGLTGSRPTQAGFILSPE